MLQPWEREIQEFHKSNEENINKALGLYSDLVKAKPASVGEIRQWGNKKYKKQPNGKWIEVSEHGMTKKEHEFESDLHDEKSKDSGFNSKHQEESKDKSGYHKNVASKLSYKEYDESELSGGDKGKEKNYMESMKDDLDKFEKEYNSIINKPKDENGKRKFSYKETLRKTELEGKIKNLKQQIGSNVRHSVND